MSTPAMAATTPPTASAESRRASSRLASGKAESIHWLIRMPENAPTLMKPACPRLSSPEMPTVRFSDTAMTMYTQIGTS